eukprot:scaffold40574_cov27-Tisochrysis_lutea.AAC.18
MSTSCSVLSIFKCAVAAAAERSAAAVICDAIAVLRHEVVRAKKLMSSVECVDAENVASKRFSGTPHATSARKIEEARSRAKRSITGWGSRSSIPNRAARRIGALGGA